MIYFVGAGSGAPDLITVRGAKSKTCRQAGTQGGTIIIPKRGQQAKRLSCTQVRRSYRTAVSQCRR